MVLSAPPLNAPVVLVFPGQGSQRVAMAGALARRHPAAASALEHAEEATGLPLRRLCLAAGESELASSEVLQPALVAVSWAAYAAFEAAHGTDAVACVAGHSLGEISAIAAAGALPWPEAVRLAALRGRLMERAARRRPGSMLAIVGLDARTVASICRAGRRGRLWIANRNSPVQFVLSGEEAAIAEAEAMATRLGARRVLRLAVPLAAHCPFMRPAAAPFERAVWAAPLQAARWPVLANADGRPLTLAAELRQELRGHLLRAVDWTSTMLRMARLGCRTVVELGPGRVLASLAAKHLPGVATWNMEELLEAAVPEQPRAG